MKTQKGFTLLELMVTVSIVGIVLSLAAPSARDMINSAESRSGFRNISSALSLARSEAVNRQGTVSVCPTTNRTDCGTNWSAGFIVFRDINANGSIDAGDTIIRVFDALGAGLTLTHSMTDGSPTRDYVRYGESAMLLATADAGNFVVCDSRGAIQAKAIVINATGQLRPATDTNNDGHGIVDIAVTNGAGNIVAQDATCP